MSEIKWLFSILIESIYYCKILISNKGSRLYDIIKHRIISSTLDVQLGDWYAGGFVFYADGNGGGFIAAPYDQGTAQWGCFGTAITGADGTAIGTG